jgi:hypothetical protein
MEATGTVLDWPSVMLKVDNVVSTSARGIRPTLSMIRREILTHVNLHQDAHPVIMDGTQKN